MITDKDIKKLRKEFKKDFVTKHEFNKSIEELIKMMAYGFDRVLKKMDDHINKQNGHRIAKGNHEERIQDIEQKIISQTSA